MRDTVESGMLIRYPDEVCFAFNPTLLQAVIDGDEATVMIDGMVTKRSPFNKLVAFDLSGMLQELFQRYYLHYGRLSKNVEVVLTSSTGSFTFTTLVVWGALQIDQEWDIMTKQVTWFKNFPFTIDVYTKEPATAIPCTVDGVDRNLFVPNKGISTIDINMEFPEATKEIYIGESKSYSTFDYTFDYTFQNTDHTGQIYIKVDPSTCGTYLRWVGNQGEYKYYLLNNENSVTEVSNDGEFLDSYNLGVEIEDSYNTGTGYQQGKARENVIQSFAFLVDSKTYDLLLELVSSPVIDLFYGYDTYSMPKWVTINVLPGSWTKTDEPLQDFEVNLLLPEQYLQSL